MDRNSRAYWREDQSTRWWRTTSPGVKVARARSHDAKPFALWCAQPRRLNRPPPPGHLVRLVARIDRESRSNNLIERWQSRIREWLEKFELAFQETPSPTRWALAAQDTSNNGASPPTL